MRDEYRKLMMTKPVDSMATRLARWKTTKWVLFSAMASDSAPIVEVNGICVLLKSIEREDGGGQRFNLVLGWMGTDYKCFVTTD